MALSMSHEFLVIHGPKVVFQVRIHDPLEADLAQRRFMLVDPNNRLVADTLEGEWNEKLRVLAKAREDRERASVHHR
jgi:hypothetical protein